MGRLAGLLLGLAAVVGSSPAAAAPRMAIGFQDDATFRWSAGAADAVARAGAAHASVIRTVADWRALAPRRPAVAADSFDPAYRFGDLDELVQERAAAGHPGDDHDLGHASRGRTAATAANVAADAVPPT